MTLWLNHTIDERIAMLQRAEEKFRINQVAIEKDWWVTVVLNALFKCSCADQLIFSTIRLPGPSTWIGAIIRLTRSTWLLMRHLLRLVGLRSAIHQPALRYLAG